MAATDTLPPHDEAAEAGLLGCILSANGNAAQLADQVCLEDFYDQRHRLVLHAITRLLIDGKQANTVATFQWLKDKKELESAGGLEYVISLEGKTPSEHQFPAFLETVKDRSIRRAAIRDSAEINRLANDTAIPSSAIAAASKRLLEAHAKPSGNLPAIVDVADFMVTPLDQPQVLIDGLLHRGEKLAVGGGSKSFKTWTLLDMAQSVAAGVPWMGRETTPGRVLYVNFEIQPFHWQGRLSAVASARGITLEKGCLHLWNLRGKAANYEVIIPKVKAAAKDGFDLIVLDPIYKLYGLADENSAGDVASLMNALEDLTVTTGAALAFGAHFSKGNQSAKESIDRISGSGVFARDPDSLLIFTRHEEEDAFTVEPTLRNFPQVDPFVVRWQYPLMVPDAELDPSKLKQVAGRKRLHFPDDLLKLLPETGLRTKDWQDAAIEEGIPRSTFHSLKKELEQADRVIHERSSNLWKPINKA